MPARETIFRRVGLARPKPGRYASCMQFVAYIGIALTLLGLAGVIWCIRSAIVLRKSDAADDPELGRKQMSRMILVNMASIAIAFFGMGLMVVGLLLG